jgi:hypothetical protein
MDESRQSRPIPLGGEPTQGFPHPPGLHPVKVVVGFPRKFPPGNQVHGDSFPVEAEGLRGNDQDYYRVSDFFLLSLYLVDLVLGNRSDSRQSAISWMRL